MLKLKNIKFIASAAVAMSLSTVALAQDAATGAAAQAPDRTQMWLTVAFYVLLVVASGIILGVIGRILKVYELTSSAAGSKKGINWNSINASLLLIIGFLGLYASWWELGVHGKMLLPEAASINGAETDRLFHITFVITYIVFILTHILLFTYAYVYRERKGRKALYYPHNDNVEKIWTLIPAIVLTILVFFGWKAWTNIFSPESAKNAIVVNCVGEQFKWTIRYAGKDNELGKSNYRLIGGDNVLGVDYKDPKSHDDFYPTEIVLPVGKPVQFVFGAKDVIHSAYMPHFRAQMNCVPGMPTYFAFTPTITTNAMRSKVNDSKFNYLLYCNKICGASHFNMAFVIKVVSMREYREWLKGQKPFYVMQQEKLHPVTPVVVPTTAPADSVKTDSTVNKTLASIK